MSVKITNGPVTYAASWYYACGKVLERTFFMYEIGDYVVCPGHGVGQILKRESKEIAGQTLSTLTIAIVANGMKVIVPEGSKEVRALVTENEVQSVFELLRDHNVNPSRETWNRRHREYMLKVNSGSVLEIADVLRSLLILRFTKKLSFSEKKMVDLCKDLLVREIALTTGSKMDNINHEIESIFSVQ